MAMHKFKIAFPFAAFAFFALTAHASGTASSTAPQAIDGRQHSTTLEKIRQRGRLIVGNEFKFPTMNVRNPATGVNEGFMADLARALAKRMLGDAGKVEFAHTEDETRLEYVVKGDVDMLIDTTGDIPKRREIVDFSDETFRSGSALLVKNGSPIRSIDDIHRGTRVIYVKANPDIKVIKAKAPDATYIEFTNSSDAMAALKADKGDVFTQVVTHLYRAASEDPDYTLVGRFTAKSYNIVIKKGDTALRDYLNDFLRSMKVSGEYDRLYRKWFAQYGGDIVR